ncbi:unnamed protein product [Caenorhabditis angaria]|uniref:Uncharacterized protein n=1 Tax=Caenorhabditis angaria TaxID=860376 RepID=A0A9P1IBC2_9PELO|nr:unnamed protein product [Caenorhabditis angaria]
MFNNFTQEDDGSICLILVSITFFLVAFAYFSTKLIYKLANQRFAQLVAEQKLIDDQNREHENEKEE